MSKSLKRENEKRKAKGEPSKLFTSEELTMKNASELINGTAVSLNDVTKPKKGESADDVPPPTVAPLVTLHDEMIIAMEKQDIEWAGRHHTPDIMHFDFRSEHFKNRR